MGRISDKTGHDHLFYLKILSATKLIFLPHHPKAVILRSAENHLIKFTGFDKVVETFPVYKSAGSESNFSSGRIPSYSWYSPPRYCRINTILNYGVKNGSDLIGRKVKSLHM